MVATLNRLVNKGDFKLIVIHERNAGVAQPIVESIMTRGRTTLIFALIPDLIMEAEMWMEELVMSAGAGRTWTWGRYPHHLQRGLESPPERQ